MITNNSKAIYKQITHRRQLKTRFIAQINRIYGWSFDKSVHSDNPCYTSPPRAYSVERTPRRLAKWFRTCSTYTTFLEILDGLLKKVDDVEAAFNELRTNGLEKDGPGYRVDKYGDTSLRVFFGVAPDRLCYCLGQRL